MEQETAFLFWWDRLNLHDDGTHLKKSKQLIEFVKISIDMALFLCRVFRQLLHTPLQQIVGSDPILIAHRSTPLSPHVFLFRVAFQPPTLPTRQDS